MTKTTKFTYEIEAIIRMLKTIYTPVPALLDLIRKAKQNVKSN